MNDRLRDVVLVPQQNPEKLLNLVVDRQLVEGPLAAAMAGLLGAVGRLEVVPDLGVLDPAVVVPRMVHTVRMVRIVIAKAAALQHTD